MSVTETLKESITAVLTDFFGVFDNRDNREPDWAMLRDLCSERVRIVKCEVDHEQIDDINEFIEPRKAILSSGELIDFHENLIDVEIQSFGRIAHAFVTYRKQGIYQGEPLLGYGKKSIQLLKEKDGWKIFSITWFDESGDYLIEHELKR